MQSEIYIEQGDTKSQKKGLNFNRRLIGIIVCCITIVCILAVVLGLIPVYIAAGNPSSPETTMPPTQGVDTTSTDIADVGSTSEETTETTETTTLAAPLTAEGTTNVVVTTLFSTTTNLNSRFLSRTILTCTPSGTVDIGTLGNDLENIIKQQPIRACDPIVEVRPSCTEATGVLTVAIRAIIRLANPTVYCSPLDISNSLAIVSTQFHPLVEAKFPAGTVAAADYTTVPITFNGVSSSVNVGNREYETFTNCDFVNGNFPTATCRAAPAAVPEVAHITTATGSTNLRIRALMLRLTEPLIGRRILACPNGQYDLENSEELLYNRIAADGLRACRITKILTNTACQINNNGNRIISFNVEIYLDGAVFCDPTNIRTSLINAATQFNTGFGLAGTASPMTTNNGVIFVNGTTNDGTTFIYTDCIYTNTGTPTDPNCRV